MTSKITAAVFRQLTPYQTEIIIEPSNIRFPIIGSLDDLISAKENTWDGSYACLVRKEKLVLCWTDSAESILLHGADVERKLLGSVCLVLLFPI